MVEQATTGIGVIPQGLAKPLVTGHVQHQAMAAFGAATGMMCAAGHHHQALLHHLAAQAVHLEIQAPGQAEHQLRVFMAVGDQVVAVVA